MGEVKESSLDQRKTYWNHYLIVDELCMPWNLKLCTLHKQPIHEDRFVEDNTKKIDNEMQCHEKTDANLIMTELDKYLKVNTLQDYGQTLTGVLYRAGRGLIGQMHSII